MDKNVNRRHQARDERWFRFGVRLMLHATESSKFLSYIRDYRLNSTVAVYAQNCRLRSCWDRLSNVFLWLCWQYWLLAFVRCICWVKFNHSSTQRCVFWCSLELFLSDLRTHFKRNLFKNARHDLCLFLSHHSNNVSTCAFSFMQADDIEKGIMTVDEMVEEKFTFLVTGSLEQTTEELNFHER